MHDIILPPKTLETLGRRITTDTLLYRIKIFRDKIFFFKTEFLLNDEI